MLSVSDYFQQAQLSLASYALHLTQGMTGGGQQGKPSNYASLLIDGGMSEVQAIAFADKYTVVDQYTDPVSGFSGTVFQDTSGKIFMAMRGTEAAFSGPGNTDWEENIANIGADGIAIDQGIVMYNWYQRMITPVGQPATQYIYHKEVTDPTGLTIIEVLGTQYLIIDNSG